MDVKPSKGESYEHVRLPDSVSKYINHTYVKMYPLVRVKVGLLRAFKL